MEAYRRGPAGSHDGWLAAALGLVSGALVFYLARTWLRREPIVRRDTDARRRPSRD